ncbi:transmembrane protein 131 homolog [Phlebotomus argentipes]|uniref:transmembrane protein 131 homolog n=1 Tax=Phlebotomus argentipes TaxID=94469 RepID=UPI002892CAC0|nr:transmembrane protein 131 homolog [Phlebotomus argentipes]
MLLLIAVSLLATLGRSLASAGEDLAGGFDTSSPLVLDSLLEETLPEASSHLVALPKALDFGDQSLGSPQTRVVTLVNSNSNRSVFLDAIVATADAEASVFFTSFVDKVIPPLSNTSFSVIFLPKRHGPVETHLLIHTTFGLLRFPVRGRGIECPYRLVPLVGIKAPFNATISPEIHLFNPHDKPIQIVEIFSSGGHFQLELPSGGNEGPQVLWEIPPLCSKPIIRVRFVGVSPGNYTAYVRIKIQGQDAQLAEKVLVVPIEVEISRERGLYSPLSLLNLGLHGSTDRVSVFRVNLTHSGADSGVRVTGLRGDNEITNRSLSLQIDEDARQRWLIVEVNWAKVWSPYLMGNIVISSEVDGEPQLPYHMPVFGLLLNGSAQHAGNITILLSNKKQLAKTHGFTFTNKFAVPLMVTNVSVADEVGMHHLRLMDFDEVLLAPDESLTLFRVQFVNYTQPIARNYSVVTEIRITTNATVYTIPVYAFTGFLRRVVPVYEGPNMPQGDEGALDFGTVPVSTSFDSNIAFINENPVTVAIKGWTGKLTSSASYSIILLGCSDGPALANLVICSELEPRQWMVFQITVKSYGVGNYTGQLIVNTDFEEIVTPIHMIAEMGGLALDQELLHFKDCFPEKICSLNLSAHSTFMKPMQVEAISVIDGIINYEYATDEDVLPEIPPNIITNIGRLYFDPKGLCGEYCYTGSQVSNKIHPKKSSSLVNYSHYTKLDKDVLSFRIKSFHKMRSSIQSIPFKLSTSQIKRYDFVASVNFVWPRLVTEHVEFLSTQVGQGMAKFITIDNPSDQLLITQYFLHDTQVHGQDVELPPEVITPCSTCVLAKEKLFAFHSFFSTSSTLENYFDHIPPRGSSKVAIRFQSPRAGTFSTLLFIRNNLTILEAVWLTAKAVVPQLKFGNRRPGSQTPLLFELTDKHFKVCADAMAERERLEKEGKFTDDVPRAIITMKRSFTARNSGEVPITINAMKIDSELCEGYGFKVLNCSAFELAPNASRKIEIAFSPDFILSRITRPLILETSAGYPVNYTLLSTIPADVVTMCHRALLRPRWEATMKRGTMAVSCLVLIGIMVFGYIESRRLMKAHIVENMRDKGPVLPALDLRKITRSSDEPSQPVVSPPAQPQATKSSSFLGLGTKKKLGKKIVIGEVNPLSFSPKFDLNKQVEASVKVDSVKTEPTPKTEKVVENRKSHPLSEVTESVKPPKSLSPNASVRTEVKPSPKRSLTPPSPQQPVREVISKASVSPEPEKRPATPPPAPKTLEVTPPAVRKHVKQVVKKTKSLPVANVETSSVLAPSPSPQPKPAEAKAPTPKLAVKEPERQSTPVIAERPPSSPSPDVTYEVQNGSQTEIIRPKRYGKTPGRERRSRLTKRNGLTKPQFKPSTTSFTSPMENSPEAPASSVWDENKASFSYVVAQKPPSPEVVSTEKIGMDFGVFAQPPAPVELPRTDSAMNGVSTPVWKVNELGPIGTKKSPRSSNTSWVDVEPMRKPLGQDNFNLETLTSLQDNSNSFYSGSTTVLETYLKEKLQYAREKQKATNLNLQHSQDKAEELNGGEWNSQSLWTNGFEQPRWQQSPIRRPPPGLDFLQRNNNQSLFMNGIGGNDENYNSMPAYELFSSPWEHEMASNLWQNSGQKYPKKQQ